MPKQDRRVFAVLGPVLLLVLQGACGQEAVPIEDSGRRDVGLLILDGGIQNDALTGQDRFTPGDSGGSTDRLGPPDSATRPDSAVSRDTAVPGDRGLTADTSSPPDTVVAPDTNVVPDGSSALDASITPDASVAQDGSSGDGSSPGGPSRYPHNALFSPLTPAVVQHLRALRAANASLLDDVFIKVGASGTVTSNFMQCFAGAPYTLDLDGRSDLQSSIAHFAAGDASGTTPYQRQSLAAEVGRTAQWAITGDPSPLTQEVTALQPRIALVNYGTNDMNMGTTHASALYPFYTSMWALLEQLADGGIIPVVTGLNPRTDTVEAARWVPTYNAVTRGLAEVFQVPFYDLYASVVGLSGSGMLSDGIHGNVYTPSTAQPCVFSTAGLAYNYNLRNLNTMDLLDGVKRSVIDGQAAPEAETTGFTGDGSAASPWIIDTLPFTHYANTGNSPHESIDSYPACDLGQDESGPEYYYRLELAQAEALRFVVLDLFGVDVDLHVLGNSLNPGTCVERNDKIVDRTLAAGTHHLVLDTWVSGGVPLTGEYLLVVLRCEAGDPDCL